ncbi:MAG: molybdate ABC transporter permease subunit [Rhodospirillaceae bacterium]|jgi:molybdate transport system permease protein|nr:molybdate ABC transporter permease subunit [Rhodospirillaceae bacterium]MBT5239619.1 molybdate ABC transporter permease subunit [Rhodospirillaceae bacterium]MBT5564100.1 molybdate ABC transporter permease subunit [Rhodospirillaceae bacterium]MBT6089897.1 molybdate ABC transporter permease subunit [Rhodospirillaceae bacterium]
MFGFSTLELEALQISLKVALWSVTWSFPLALGTAWLLARKEFRGKAVLNAVIHVPLVVPPVVIGYLLLVLLGRQGIVGAWLNDWFDVGLVFTWQGAAIAASVVAFPLFVRPIRQALEGVDPRLEEAAVTLGADRRQAFFAVTLPIVMPGIISGALLFFARALGEFGATITFAANIPGETQTLPLALYTATQTPGGDTIAMRLVLLSLVLALAALLASEWLSRRSYFQLRGH